MKKYNLFRFSVLLCLVISVITIQAIATSATKTAQLIYNNIKISLDGVNLTPTDANGNPVEPFVINGTTYLPVRAVGNALGLNVNWNGVTNTAELSTPKTINGIVVYEDSYVLIKFVGCTKETSFSSKEYNAIFNVTNKTGYELTFQCDALAFNGISFNNLGGSEEVAPNSTGNIKFYTYDDELPLTGITKLSGTIRVIDFTYELLSLSYDAKFVDITAS